MKKFLLVFMLMINTLSFSAITIKDNSVYDNFNNRIELKEYKKIVILDPAAIETFYMIGAEENIAAISTTSRSSIFPAEKTKLLPNVGHMNNSSIEKILSFTPDLVIINPMSSKMVESIKPFNIPFIVVESNTFAEILNNIKIYGEITGKREEAEKVYRSSQEKLNTIKNSVTEKPLNIKGGVLYSTSPIMAFNSKSLPGQILNFLGVKNLTDNLVGDKPILSPEFILQENPDFLAGAMSISNPEDILKSSNIISKTKAGKDKNIFIIDSTKILRGSPRIFDTVEELYRELQSIK